MQLIGNLGNAPEVKTLESGKKMARFSVATSESYRNAKGEKVSETQWHTLVAWGKVAEIVEKYLNWNPHSSNSSLLTLAVPPVSRSSEARIFLLRDNALLILLTSGG